jgi:hypothetical protein
MSGKIFDVTGSYQAAVVNGILWNALNLSIATWLFLRLRRMNAATAAPSGASA